jgi:hypothetical protein
MAGVETLKTVSLSTAKKTSEMIQGSALPALSTGEAITALGRVSLMLPTPFI